MLVIRTVNVKPAALKPALKPQPHAGHSALLQQEATMSMFSRISRVLLASLALHGSVYAQTVGAPHPPAHTDTIKHYPVLDDASHTDAAGPPDSGTENPFTITRDLAPPSSANGAAGDDPFTQLPDQSNGDAAAVGHHLPSGSSYYQCNDTNPYQYHHYCTQ